MDRYDRAGLLCDSRNEARRVEAIGGLVWFDSHRGGPCIGHSQSGCNVRVGRYDNLVARSDVIRSQNQMESV